MLEKAKHPTAKGPRGGARYVCAECGKHFGIGDLNVDHIEPVIPLHKPRTDMTWDEIIIRMFYCPDDNFQVLCKKCHDIKSKQENAERRKNKRGKR